MSYTYTYPRPSVTVDIIVVNKTTAVTKVLLIERKFQPFKNCWALPGGFIDKNENLIEAAHRELKEETHLTGIDLKQFHTFGDTGRDPRGHTVSVVYYGYIERHPHKACAGDDAQNIKWFDTDNLPKMAFDHNKILNKFILEILS